MRPFQQHTANSFNIVSPYDSATSLTMPPAKRTFSHSDANVFNIVSESNINIVSKMVSTQLSPPKKTLPFASRGKRRNPSVSELSEAAQPPPAKRYFQQQHYK